MRKTDFPVHRARRWLEPGPVVLVTSRRGDEIDVMTLGWHTVLEFSPSLIGLMISAGNHSFGLIRDSGECVVNVPPASLLDAVVGVGNATGARIDKFAEFELTPEPAAEVAAPLIAECPASFECRLHDDALVESRNFFVFEIVKAHVAPGPRPETAHYMGDGEFMISGRVVDKSALFRPEML